MAYNKGGGRTFYGEEDLEDELTDNPTPASVRPSDERGSTEASTPNVEDEDEDEPESEVEPEEKDWS